MTKKNRRGVLLTVDIDRSGVQPAIEAHPADRINITEARTKGGMGPARDPDAPVPPRPAAPKRLSEQGVGVNEVVRLLREIAADLKEIRADLNQHAANSARGRRFVLDELQSGRPR